MNEDYTGRENFRLNLNDPDDLLIAEWLLSQKNGRKSDAIKKALLSYLSGIVVTFDNANKIDSKIIESIRHLENEPRRASIWMKERIYERLTGEDATTGEPLQQFVRVIEKPVITERVKIVEKLVPYATGELPQQTEQSQEAVKPDLDELAKGEALNTEW